MTKQQAWNKRNADKMRAYHKEYSLKTANNIRYRWSRLKSRARRAGRKFRIAFKTYEAMIKGGCYYCGADLTAAKGGSLDRVNNNNRNYTTRNVVACCEDCNNLKNYQLTKDETVYVIKSLKRFRKKVLTK
jgi:5-methylcytosine-specific restriction endonuclease McrA